MQWIKERMWYRMFIRCAAHKLEEIVIQNPSKPLNCSLAADGVWDKKSSVLCLGNLILHATFFLRDCRGKKRFGTDPEICWMWSLFEGWENMSFGSRGLFQRKRARTNETRLRSTHTCPAATAATHPLFLPRVHTLSAELWAARPAVSRIWKPLPKTPETSTFAFANLSVGAQSRFLSIVSRASWRPDWRISPRVKLVKIAKQSRFRSFLRPVAARLTRCSSGSTLH